MKHGLDELLKRGVEDSVFPLARADVWFECRHVFSGGNAPPQTVFDLASLTKVVCTTALLLDSNLDLATPVRDYLPSVAHAASLDDLLFHGSGLQPFLPFFAEALTRRPQLVEERCSVEDRLQTRDEVLARVLSTPPEAAVNQRTAYSDLGFIQLGAVLEATSSTPLDHLFARKVAGPLGLSASFRRLSAHCPLPPSLADTGATRPREPAPGQEGLWSIPTGPTSRGEVDDDNAWVLDGVSGHAGLFGTSQDIATFGRAVLEGQVAPGPGGWAVDTLAGSTRTRGFDTPSREAASCGARFGRAGPRGAIGHLGFTGTSLWVDLDRQLVVTLLTNRVALGRANVRLREFRPLFHDAVLDALGLK